MGEIQRERRKPVPASYGQERYWLGVDTLLAASNIKCITMAGKHSRSIEGSQDSCQPS